MPKKLSSLLMLLLATASLARAASGPAEDLLAAARAKDCRKLAAALAAGADANVRDAEGRTALMLAADAESFGACRELLWAGADANARDKAGRTALEHVAQATQQNIPLRFLLRCYAYLQLNAQRAKARPEHPNLVMIMEDSVNYLHPRLKAAYQVNNVELLGKSGVDDDGDGFVDDVYGWDPIKGKPFRIRELQVDAYLKHRDAIARILRIDDDCATGKITRDEAQLQLSEYTNPLSDIMGPIKGLSDGDFLDMLKHAAHGTHIAGIVLDSSEGKARLQTLSLDFVEEARRRFGPDNDAFLTGIHAASFDPEVVLKQMHARLLALGTERGRVISRYLRATGAGVANLSFGGGLPGWKEMARVHIQWCNEDRARNGSSPVLDLALDRKAERWGLELYSAGAVNVALAMYENPDVLFVVSAGNDHADNDLVLTEPAYLARFFPNVITVASTSPIGLFSEFSNFGGTSVDIAAPGEDVVSTLFPEATVRMSGTSMAAPYVAGVAALMRTIAPAVGAAELRRLIDYTARENPYFHGLVASAGSIDKETLRGCFTGSARAQSDAQARIAINAAWLEDEDLPRHAADAARAAEKALALDQANPEAWRARAVSLSAAGDPKQALEAIDRSLRLDPNSEPAWMSRAVIATQLKDNARVFESVGKAIDVLAAQGELFNFMRAARLALRASLHLQLKEVEPARADARLARQLNPWVELSPELEALL